MYYIQTYRTPILLFVLACAVRLLFYPYFDVDNSNLVEMGVALDGYYQIAENMMAGNGFTQTSEHIHLGPDSVRTPLYPLFIVALVSMFGTYVAVFALQIGISAGSTILAWLIAREFLSSRGAFVVGVLMALEPFTAYLSGLLMTETLFTFLFLFSIWLLLRFFSTHALVTLAVSSFLLGIATLVKPTVQYLPVLTLFALAFSHRFRPTMRLAKEFAIVIGIFILCIAPWTWRNYSLFGTTELSVQPVSNMYIFLVPSTIAFETGQTHEQAVADFFAQEKVSSVDDIITLANADYYRKRAFDELKKHPEGLVMSLGMTLWTFFTHDNYAMVVDRYTTTFSHAHPPLATLVSSPREAIAFVYSLMHRLEALIVVGRIFWIMTSLLSFAGVILYALRRDISPAFLFVIGAVAYFAVTTSVIGLAVNGRFRIPVDPIIFIFAVYALKTIFNKRPDGDNTVAKTDLLPFGNRTR